MDISTTNSPPQRSPKTSPIVNQSLTLYLNMKRSKESLILGIVTSILLGILLFDLNQRNSCGEILWSFWHYMELGASIILGLSLVYYVITFLYYNFCFDFVRGTNSQKTLLSFDDNSFIVDKPVMKEKEIDSDTINITNLSFQKEVSLNSSTPGNTSAHQNYYNASNMSHSFNNATFSLNNSEQNTSASNLFLTPTKNTSLKNEFISDQKSLQNYLNSFTEQERNIATAMNIQSNISGFNTSGSFWSPNTNQRNHSVFDDLGMFLRTTLYQLSPVQTKPSKDEIIYSSTKSVTPTDYSDESKKVSAKLSNFVANLRMWISSTILSRLVSEINKIDESFQQRSLGDLKIGSVGLEKLKKIAENPQLVQMVPQLPTLIPFLDLTSNQEYLVNRIKELAKGSCMANYKWNSGSFDSSYNEEHIPTDSGIIFHLFCTYLDSQIWRSPEFQRPFSDRYVSTVGCKEIKNKSKCAIICSSPMKPKFSFISDGKIQQFSNDRNGLFYAIIQFLNYMKNNANGALEGVQLGRSGINILCVVEDS